MSKTIVITSFLIGIIAYAGLAWYFVIYRFKSKQNTNESGDLVISKVPKEEKEQSLKKTFGFIFKISMILNGVNLVFFLFSLLLGAVKLHPGAFIPLVAGMTFHLLCSLHIWSLGLIRK